MKRRQIPRSQRSQRLRGGSPAIALECAAAPRLACLCAAPAALLVLALFLAPAPGLPIRSALALATLWALLPAGRLVAALPGPHRVRAILWDERGRWWLTDADGVCVAAHLAGAWVFGPFVFLRWKDSLGCSRRAVVDAAAAPAPPARALIGRLRLTRGYAARQASAKT